MLKGKRSAEVQVDFKGQKATLDIYDFTRNINPDASGVIESVRVAIMIDNKNTHEILVENVREEFKLRVIDFHYSQSPNGREIKTQTWRETNSDDHRFAADSIPQRVPELYTIEEMLQEALKTEKQDSPATVHQAA